MATIRLLPNALHFREFQTDPITGHYYHNTCGETALAGARVATTPQNESTAEAISLMTQITRDMMDLGWADRPEGATTTRNLYAYALRKGWKVAQPYVGWQDPIPSDKLHPWLLQYAGVKPIVLMITRAGYGLTAIDGGHPERGVNGHFITVLGLADEGYITLDGDSNHAAQHLDIYPWKSIEAANVTGFLMLEMEQPPLGAPSGWTDNPSTGVLTASNGQPVISGFRNTILNWPGGWPAVNVPRGPEYGKSAAEGGIEPGNPKIGAGSRQDFIGASVDKNVAGVVSLGWTQERGVYVIWAGQDMGVYEKRLKDDAAEIANLKAQLAAGTLTQAQKDDLAAMSLFRAAMKR